MGDTDYLFPWVPHLVGPVIADDDRNLAASESRVSLQQPFEQGQAAEGAGGGEHAAEAGMDLTTVNSAPLLAPDP